MSQIELRESLEVIKTTKDEMALEDFIVDITGKVVQNIEEIQHLFKVDKFNKIKNLVRELKFYTQLNTQEIYQDDIVQFAFDKCALKHLNLLQNQLLARITRNSFASFNMEKLDCK
jgi:hypothetical protein